MSYLNLETWPRRSTYTFFRAYEMPFFGICVQLDITATLNLSRERAASFALAAWYACLKAANATPSLRYRLRHDGVWIHDQIHAGVTTLFEDETIGFCYIDFNDDFPTFHRDAKTRQAALKPGQLEPQPDRDDLIHGSIFPWMPFTGLTHARRVVRPTEDARPDSTPKIMFGGYFTQNDRVLMPVSIEAHHALMDGLHAARFLKRFQDHLADPEAWLAL